MKLKLIAVGNSTGVILPKEFLEKLRLQRGDELQALEIPDGYAIKAFDPELTRQMEVAESIMRKRRNVLRKLAE
jgi:putative addiction module antidote